MDTFNSYVYRGQKPNPLPTPAPKRISTPAGQRLSTILENGSNTGGGRNAAHVFRNAFGLTNLSPARSEQHGIPPRHSEEKRPPSYATTQESFRPAALPLSFRERLMQRGGWKRVGLVILAVIVILAIALGVGLGVGLSKTNSNNNATAPSSPSALQGPFPIGAYAITAFLTNVSTSCTSDAATWLCYPYNTYASSPSQSEAPFNWVITPSSTPNQYQISSSDNPLSLLFTNASLSLVDANTSTERYTFSVPNIVKNVLPTVSLTNNNIRSSCFYNSTILRASLFTRMNATLLEGVTPLSVMMMQGNAGIVFNNTWPGAVMVEQVANGGADVPNCYSLSNGVPSGSEIPLTTETDSSQCSCVYRNYQTT